MGIRCAFILSILFVSRLASALDTPRYMQQQSPREHTVVPDAHVASPPPSRRTSWTGDRVAFLAHLGIGAPAGALGLDLDVAPVRALAVHAGIGRSPGGAQYALLARVRLPIATSASGRQTLFTIGGGPSIGRYENGTESAGLACLWLCALEQNGESPATQTFERALWYNLELGLDIYAAEGSGLLRTTLGYGLIANDQDYACAPSPSGSYPPNKGCDRSSGRDLAFFMIAYGFDL